MKRASEQQLKGILSYTTAPNVSIDFNHDPHSAPSTWPDQGAERHAGAGDAWYDNEWGFPTAWPIPPWRWGSCSDFLASWFETRAKSALLTMREKPHPEEPERSEASRRIGRARRSMTKTFRTLDDVDVKGRRVLLRVDLNVPMEMAASPTRRGSNGWRRPSPRFRGKGGKVILLAHSAGRRDAIPRSR